MEKPRFAHCSLVHATAPYGLEVMLSPAQPNTTAMPLQNQKVSSAMRRSSAVLVTCVARCQVVPVGSQCNQHDVRDCNRLGWSCGLALHGTASARYYYCWHDALLDSKAVVFLAALVLGISVPLLVSLRWHWRWSLAYAFCLSWSLCQTDCPSTAQNVHLPPLSGRNQHKSNE